MSVDRYSLDLNGHTQVRFTFPKDWLPIIDQLAKERGVPRLAILREWTYERMISSLKAAQENRQAITRYTDPRNHSGP